MSTENRSSNARPVRIGDRIRYRGWNKMEWPSGHEVTAVHAGGLSRQLDKGMIDVRREHVPDWMHADGARIDMGATFASYDHRPSEVTQQTLAVSPEAELSHAPEYDTTTPARGAKEAGTNSDPWTNDAPQHTCTGAGAVSCKACDANVAATGHRFVPAGWHDRVGYVLAEDRVGLLDDVCRWLFEAGFKDAADRLLEDRNKFICADPIQQPEQRTQEATPHELTVTAYGKTWTESQVRALLDENERLRDDANVTCGHERLIKQAKDVVRAWEDDPTSTVTENEIRELGLRADSAVDAAHRSDKAKCDRCGKRDDLVVCSSCAEELHGIIADVSRAPAVDLDYPRPIEILAAEFKKRSEGPGRVWTSSRAYENAYRDGLMRAIELLQDPRSDSVTTPKAGGTP